MRIQVQLDSAAGSLTIHADRYNAAATPPARLAATLASIIETTLTDLPLTDLTGPSTPAAACTAPSPAPAVRTLTRRRRRRPDLAPDVPAEGSVTEPADAELADAEPADAEPADVEPADVEPARVELAELPEAGAWRGPREEQLRASAARLLDEGLDDAAVCQRLGISRSRLLSWDDPASEHTALSSALATSLLSSAFAGGAR